MDWGNSINRPEFVRVFLHLMPVFSSLMAIFLLGEKLATFHILGALFIIFGIIVSTKFK